MPLFHVSRQAQARSGHCPSVFDAEHLRALISLALPQDLKTDYVLQERVWAWLAAGLVIRDDLIDIVTI
ncbi:MAG: hypothetical protein Alpg2KO_08360 [Alphaproteobacteria bacterium]